MSSPCVVTVTIRVGCLVRPRVGPARRNVRPVKANVGGAAAEQGPNPTAGVASVRFAAAPFTVVASAKDGAMWMGDPAQLVRPTGKPVRVGSGLGAEISIMVLWIFAAFWRGSRGWPWLWRASLGPTL
jgi:hypothetical protein